MKPPRLFLLAAGLMLFMLLHACGPSQAELGATATPTLTPTPTLTATPTATPKPTATLTPTRAPASASPAAGVLFASGFDSKDAASKDGWSTVAGEDTIFDWPAGNLVISADKPQIIAWNVLPKVYTDFGLEVEAKPTGDGYIEYGLIFRQDDSTTSNFYVFGVNTDGQYFLLKQMDGKWVKPNPVNGTNSRYIRKGAATNRLSVVAEGSDLYLYVNGTLVRKLTDRSLSQGHVGIFVSTQKAAGNKIAFDRFAIYTPEQAKTDWGATAGAGGVTGATSAPTPIPTFWNGIPVMANAIPSKEDQEGYVYTITVTFDQVKDFYTNEMPKAAWVPRAAQNESGKMITIYHKDNSATAVAIVPQCMTTSVTIVSPRDILAVNLTTPSQLPPSTPIYQDDKVFLCYPNTWRGIDLSNFEFCNQLNTECLVVGIYSDWTIHIMMVRYALGTTVSVDQFDREDWQQFERQNPGVHLALREIVQVGGQSAIRRVYDLPSINTSEGRDYWIRYLVGYGEDVYLFTGRATSQSSFSQLQSEMENTVASVQFAR